ncbi:uncharacterized protein LOC110901312 [Helianthus annuus]|uniref:uncharacterized protein LOC110901312 n=1 Tax=Helianthus annuus TaxID=4232 RepID=UPI000B8FB8F2|nr:uncharacterized protein LOC110901312 [Helianthus annuus]
MGNDNVVADLSGCGPQILEERDNAFLNNHNVVGSSPAFGLGKRSREVRSPPSSGSMQGPPMRNLNHDFEPGESSFDLNRPVSSPRISETRRSVDRDNPGLKLPQVDVQQQISDTIQPEDQSMVNRGGAAFDANSIREEILATVSVGSKIGINLNGFQEATKVSILDEGTRINLVNVYASNDAGVRRSIWASLVEIKNYMQGLWVLMGDFNDVRDESKRCNSEFVAANAEAFNHFILSAGLCEYNMGGASVQVLTREASDRRPVLLSTTPTDFGHIPFRCFNSWLELPGFLVHQICHNFTFNGPADVALSFKLRWLKNNIKVWLKWERDRTDGVYVEKKNRIQHLENLADERALGDEELSERADYINVVLGLDRRKQMDARQKSRARWAIEGDENSAYYHNIINSNISNNRVNGLVIDGVWVTSPVEIKENFLEFFSNQFVEPMSSRPSISCHNLATLIESEADTLVTPFSNLEIKKAIWDCLGDRAPGPDGFNFKFIKRNWDLFQNDFIKIFQDFFTKGLIDVINKAISKVLVNRLKTVFGRLVSEEQSTFLAWRNITDGPLILNEAIAWMKKAKKSGMIFKVDINKAYDSLNWNFLESVMLQMNFPVKWRKWIMATLISARASVLVNGSPTMEFKYSRGLRQGDLLSPFLFVIAMEALTGIMKKAMSEGIFEGLRCTNDGPLLSHFIYADDVVFFGRWSFVNLAKCSMFGVGINDEEVKLMADCMNSKKGSFPFKHLGLIVGANMNLIRNWKSVIDIFKSRLSIWKAKSLSYVGRITLLKSVLNSLQTYFFSLYKAPAKEKVIAPIEYGGLGFGSLRDANLAMLSKWWWRFKTDKDGLWRRVIWSVHHNERSWSPIPAKISIPDPWKQIVSVQVPLNLVGINLPDLIWCDVGSDSNALFWLDLWIGAQPLYVMFPLLFALEVDKLCRVSQRVVWESSGASFMWLWKINLNSDDEVFELQNLLDILNLFHPRAGPDIWIWKPAANLWLLGGRHQICSVGIVSWRALSERLPTKSALVARNVDVGSIGYPLCNEHPESSDHLFVACQFSQAIWLVIAQWCKIPPLITFSLKDVLDIRSAVSGSKRKKKLINAIFQVVIWSIWRLRNEVIFRQVDPNMSRVIEESKSMSYLWIKNRLKSSNWSWGEWRNFSFVM